jgi:hypothetical protein
VALLGLVGCAATPGALPAGTLHVRAPVAIDVRCDTKVYVQDAAGERVGRRVLDDDGFGALVDLPAGPLRVQAIEEVSRNQKRYHHARVDLTERGAEVVFERPTDASLRITTEPDSPAFLVMLFRGTVEEPSMANLLELLGDDDFPNESVVFSMDDDGNGPFGRVDLPPGEYWMFVLCHDFKPTPPTPGAHARRIVLQPGDRRTLYLKDRLAASSLR